MFSGHWSICSAGVVFFALISSCRAKCVGSSCTGMEQDAQDSGLLAGNMNECRGRDRIFDFNPAWKTELDSELQYMEWSGEDDQWVWAVTTGAAGPVQDGQFHHVYWSKDHGVTLRDRFDDLTTLVKAQVGAGYDPAQHDLHASVARIFVNSKSQNKVILWGEGIYAFTSDDGGENLKVVPMPEGTYGVSHQIRQHPTQPDWLLSLAYRNSCYDQSVPGCSMDLWLSKDFAQSWTNLTAQAGGKIAGFLDFDWGYKSNEEKYKNIFKEETILATAHTNVYRTQLDVISEDISLYRSDNDFKDFTILASCGAAFELVAGQVFFVHPDVCTVDVAGNQIKPKSSRRNALTLYVSSNGQDFGEVCMPTELSDAAYTMISTEDGRGAFMIADHVDKDAAISNLYANGNIAELYTMSLRNVHFGFSRIAKPDLLPLKPIPGRYIANQLESAQHSSLPQRVNDLDFSAVTVTKVSHNAGASWNLIAVDPRSVSSDACKSSCTAGQPCYLHLHGASSWVRGSTERPSVYAAESAPGLVLASGNLGPEKLGLKTDKDDLCTWLSRDGGITWVDIIDDVYIYEFLNHGNAIAMAKFREEGAAEYVHVSLDQGQCFYSIRLKPLDDDDTELFVNNILVEPDGAATIMHVTGSEHRLSDGMRKDVVYTIDLRGVLSSKDVNGTALPPRGQCEPSDFENWRSSDESGNPQCIMGKEYTFYRMARTNRNAPCFLPKDYSLAQTSAVECDCELQDFYCEYGYEKVSNGNCEKMAIGHAPKCEAIEIDAYTPSESHLRLSHSQSCPNLDLFISDTDGNGNMGGGEWTTKAFNEHRQKNTLTSLGARSRGDSRSRGGSGGGLWTWLLALIAVFAVITGLAKFGPDSVKEAMASAVESGVSGAVWAYDGARGLLRRGSADNPEAMGFERLGDSHQQDLYAVP